MAHQVGRYSALGSGLKGPVCVHKILPSNVVFEIFPEPYLVWDGWWCTLWGIRLLDSPMCVVVWYTQRELMHGQYLGFHNLMTPMRAGLLKKSNRGGRVPQLAWYKKSSLFSLAILRPCGVPLQSSVPPKSIYTPLEPSASQRTRQWVSVPFVWMPLFQLTYVR